MKLSISDFNLRYARESREKADEVKEDFMQDALRQNDKGEFIMPLKTYRKLTYRYQTRARQCARRYWRKSKHIKKLMDHIGY